LGRPLPRGSAGVPRIPDDVQLPPDESLTEAQRLLDDGMPFHAHEILEGTWKISVPDERALWQGLAQLAVGMTHLLRGNERGAQSLLTQGRNRIWPYHVDPPHGVDVDGLIAWADGLVDALERGQVPTPTVPRLRA
jgi:predicted metal-dependent hydrolase